MNTSLEQMEVLLSPWGASVEEAEPGTFRIFLADEADLDAACATIPQEDVIIEAALLGPDLSDVGLNAFLSISRRRLNILTIRGTSVTGDGLGCLSNAPRLEGLIVEFSKSADRACDGIAKCHALECLTIEARACSFDDALMRLKELKKLRVLEVVGLDLGSGLNVLGHLPSISQLYVESPNLNADVLQAISRAQRLDGLNLVSSRMEPLSLELLSPLSNLTALGLTGVVVTHETVRSLKSMTKVSDLTLREVSIEGGALAQLHTANLKRLNLSGFNDLNDDIVDALCKCTSLEELNYYFYVSPQYLERLRTCLPQCAL